MHFLIAARDRVNGSFKRVSVSNVSIVVRVIPLKGEGIERGFLKLLSAGINASLKKYPSKPLYKWC
jgi:hypothetical protein